MASPNATKPAAAVTANGPRNDVRLGGANTSIDSDPLTDLQLAEDVDAAIEASTECERILARRWLAQRRATLGLIVYRENSSELGKVAKAFWGGAE